MASLPPGWTADYDGQRWFFTYGPTGQSQYQFPRPGDEFPDLLPSRAFGFGVGDAGLPEVELLPEHRLESERQARRASNTGDKCRRDMVVDEEDGARWCGSLAREDSGDGAGPVCFENFAAVKSWDRHGLGGGGEEGKRTLGQSGFCEDDGALRPTNVGKADAFEESSGERLPIQLAIKREHSQADSSSRLEAGSAATISIMSEPVLAVVETRPADPAGCEQQLATVARPSPPGLPILDGGPMKATHSLPWAISVGLIPELYSESTALCEKEINPPPVELPCNEGGLDGRSVVSTTAFQKIYELPAQETPGTSLEEDDKIGRLELRYAAGNYTDTSQAGVTEAPGAKSCSHDRGGLLSQASRMQSEESWLRKKEKCARDEKPSSRKTDQPAEKAGVERRDLTHFPSVLRPGPRRSDQCRPSALITAAPVANTPNTGHDMTRQTQEHRYKDKSQSDAVPQEQPARMPAMPPLHHGDEGQHTAACTTTSPEAPLQPGGARQVRLPGSVNFVIPIQHMSGGQPHSEPYNVIVGGSPEYRLSATFASAVSSKSPPPVAGRRTSGGEAGLVTGRKAESRGWRADEAGPTQIGTGKSVTGVVPKWSWGWAR